jgi:hypothetical protein
MYQNGFDQKWCVIMYFFIYGILMKSLEIEGKSR